DPKFINETIWSLISSSQSLVSHMPGTTTLTRNRTYQKYVLNDIVQNRYRVSKLSMFIDSSSR
ncbi:hypothetical protein PIB30_054780, partial [Stylosanthes scabra]|nr:hypothetical protein [Stylosanthes scabra]